MKPHLGLLLGTTVCLLLTSCEVISEHPLSSPKTARPDPKLVGRWHEKGVTDETLEFTMKDAHWMHLEDRKKNRPTESYDLFVTVIDGNHFLNARHIDKTDPSGATKSDYFIVRYEVTDHVLSTWWMDEDKVEAAIQSGRLKGIVDEDKKDNRPHPDVDVTLQDTGENLVKFIRHTSTEALFSDKNSELYR